MPPSTVLFLAANPVQVAPLQLGDECRAIENKIRAAKFRDRIRFRSRLAARPDDLLQALNEDTPSVLHFSGHGTGERGLCFQSEDGGASSVSAEALEQVIEAAGASVVVVVLNACFSEVQAQALVAHIPCVIGMSGAIGDEAAIGYAGAFYRALAFGKSVANAHKQGLAALALQPKGGPSRDIESGEPASAVAAPTLLTRRGADADRVYIVNISTARRHCEIRIRATLKEFDADVIGRITEELRAITGDLALEILDVEEGSVRVTVSLSPAALEKLLHLRSRGWLNKILGFEVVSISEVHEDGVSETAAGTAAHVPSPAPLEHEAKPPSVPLLGSEPRASSEAAISSIWSDRGRTASASHDQLILLASSDDPRLPSSRHVLDDIDLVRFGRGPRAVRRHVDGETRVLTVQLPDRRVSVDHGCMRRVESGWLLDDPKSRNGVVVNGTLTRRTTLGDGALIELGHTFLLLRSGLLEEGAPLDLDEASLRAPVPTLATFDGALAERFAALARAAQSNVAIQILGETGTGKEVVARALHELSGRRGEFVGINCGALPAMLVEAELFGHRRGAFTGAVADRPGFFRSADGGTILLDEIGELPLTSQAALLRVITDRRVTPVGDDRPVPVDVRICSATLRDLSALVETGAFRRDLYARLVGFKLRLPALRDRRADFGLLLRARLAELPRGDRVTFTPAALRALFRYDWPLNIRELDSVMQRAVALSLDGVIDLPHLELHQSMEPLRYSGAESLVVPLRAADEDALILPPRVGSSQASVPPRASSPSIGAAEPLPTPHRHPTVGPSDARASVGDLPVTSPEDVQLRDRLVELLTEHRGNVVLVARAMGRRRMEVYRWARRFGLDLESFRR